MRKAIALLWVSTSIVGSLLAAAVQPAAAVPVTGTDVTYTTDADFDQGALANVDHDAPDNDQLQVSTGTFPFIWIALSQRCTIAKIDTETGAILGEYRTVSDGAGCAESSRTTVSFDGSVWVGHRGPGGVTHVGQVELNQCVDRNSNGTIETSTGYGDVEAWPGSGSVLADAVDECILHHVDTNAAGLFDSRHLSVDPDNKLWVGDWAGGSRFVRIDAATGTIETAARATGCGGYGGLIDRDGVIWSAPGTLLRWDPNAPDSATNPRCISLPISVYGVAIDQDGWIWASEFGNRVVKVSPDGNTIEGPFVDESTTGAQGLAVDAVGDVWVSSSLSCGGGCIVSHFKNDGTFVGSVPNPTGSGSTGVSVDAAGKVWTANRSSNTATRIDPGAGPLGCGGTGCADGVTHVGAVDLTVDFPATAGRPLPYPYNYSDMTGFQLVSGTGSWTVVQDGGSAGTEWGKITWNTEPEGSVPPGTSIVVEARAADSEVDLGSETYAVVTNGAAFDLVGQFIQVRVTLKSDDDHNSPVLSDIRITSTSGFAGTIATGNELSCGISEGSVKCWGNNGSGQLGDGTTSRRLTPVTVSGISDATALVAGRNHVCALRSDRTVACWGANDAGQLGDGTTNRRVTPVAVTGIADAVQIVAGERHTCALLDDGTARCWGDNANGQLGDGTQTRRSTPVSVQGLSGATAMAAGNVTTCAVVAGGAVSCWGNDSNGQLGNGGANLNSTVPVPVTGLTDATQVDVGLRHVCAVLASGGVKCWGANAAGSLGDGTIAPRSTPVNVVGISNAAQVSVGSDFSCARLDDGTVRCWGWNNTGQLGDNTQTNRLTPVPVVGLSDAAEISVGYQHVLARRDDGTVVAWGGNGQGQVGDGTVTTRKTPTPTSNFP